MDPGLSFGGERDVYIPHVQTFSQHLSPCCLGTCSVHVPSFPEFSAHCWVLAFSTGHGSGHFPIAFYPPKVLTVLMCCIYLPSSLFLVYVLVAQSCLTLCSPMDCSPPGSSVHRILQVRILEWVAMPFSMEST